MCGARNRSQRAVGVWAVFSSCGRILDEGGASAWRAGGAPPDRNPAENGPLDCRVRSARFAGPKLHYVRRRIEDARNLCCQRLERILLLSVVAMAIIDPPNA
jgi:hypothetical protein